MKLVIGKDGKVTAEATPLDQSLAHEVSEDLRAVNAISPERKLQDSITKSCLITLIANGVGPSDGICGAAESMVILAIAEDVSLMTLIELVTTVYQQAAPQKESCVAQIRQAVADALQLRKGLGL